jgi:molybdenum cofactor biosynthesis protein B
MSHHNLEFFAVKCGVITISDTRTFETDRSGKLIKDELETIGHLVVEYILIKDEPEDIKQQIIKLSQIEEIQVIIINGGTGIAPRDTTYETLINLFDTTLLGFGEIFRYLSYQEIGSRAMASRAIAGVYRKKLIFSLPGSTNGVKLAIEKLILPELIHLVKEINQ